MAPFLDHIRADRKNIGPRIVVRALQCRSGRTDFTSLSGSSDLKPTFYDVFRFLCALRYWSSTIPDTASYNNQNPDYCKLQCLVVCNFLIDLKSSPDTMRVQTGRKGMDPPSTIKDDGVEDRRLRDVLLQHENVRKVCDVKKLVEYSTKEGWLRFWLSFQTSIDLE